MENQTRLEIVMNEKRPVIASKKKKPSPGVQKALEAVISEPMSKAELARQIVEKVADWLTTYVSEISFGENDRALPVTRREASTCFGEITLLVIKDGGVINYSFDACIQKGFSHKESRAFREFAVRGDVKISGQGHDEVYDLAVQISFVISEAFAGISKAVALMRARQKRQNRKNAKRVVGLAKKL